MQAPEVISTAAGGQRREARGGERFTRMEQPDDQRKAASASGTIVVILYHFKIEKTVIVLIVRASTDNVCKWRFSLFCKKNNLDEKPSHS